MKLIITCLSLLLLNGCTNYLYQGNIRAADSKSIDREVVLYWNKTDPLIGDDKAGPASLLTECGSLISFDERNEGILFRGEPGRDVIASTGSQVSNGDVCGEFLNHQKFTIIGEGELEVSILCEPDPGDGFSITERSYIAAKDTPYIFNITSTKVWSFLGNTHQAPPTPECND